MFYAAFGYAQLAALISASCTPVVASVVGRDGGRGWLKGVGVKAFQNTNILCVFVGGIILYIHTFYTTK